MIVEFVTKVLPLVDKILKNYIEISSGAKCETLGEQAYSSILLKRFHSQGGSSYALYPKANITGTIKFIVSLQTISDYLDNLCDNAGVYDESAFRQLHQSMLDAVDPEKDTIDYYCHYPYKSDNNYLSILVNECRNQVKLLPSYHLVKDKIAKYIQLYSEMQTYKHLDRKIREDIIKNWSQKYLHEYPEISCWEFSAAAGSTLLVFVLFAAASDPKLTPDQVEELEKAYFPWVCGLHILLDYYIDAREDIWTGELNFTAFYENLKECQDRIECFVEQSVYNCIRLPYPKFHITIIRGLLSLYLSDPKAHIGLNRIATKNLLKAGGPATIFYFNLCRLLRYFNKL